MGREGRQTETDTNQASSARLGHCSDAAFVGPASNRQTGTGPAIGPTSNENQAMYWHSKNYTISRPASQVAGGDWLICGLLLDRDLGLGVFEFLHEFFGISLGDAFFDFRRTTLNKVLGFFQP